MGFRSNIGDVKGAFARLSDAFSVRRRVKGDRRIGDEIIDLVAATIRERTATQKAGPDLKPLAPLKRSTILRKIRKGFPPVLGIETGQMLDLGEIKGRSHVGPDAVSLEYGVDPLAQQKAEWFQEGRPGKQAPRFFYDLGEDGERRLDEYIEEIAEGARKDFEGE